MSATLPDVKGAVGPDLARALRTYGRNRLELEFRLGHRLGGRFVPGVPEAAWTRLKAKLDTSEAFEVVATHTRELICGDGTGGKYVIPEGDGRPHWMHKKRLVDRDLDTASPWCCRASLSLEETGGDRPAPTQHRFERHKRRWSYRYRCWSIDLTRVASNLPHQLDNDGVAFEVEIELADTAELLVRTLDGVLEWGWKLVADCCSLMHV